MPQKAVKCALRAFRQIDTDIAAKEEFSKTEGGSRYAKEAAELKSVKKAIIAALNELPPLERDCIWQHYIRGDSWVRISRKHAYSERQLRNITNRGLQILGKTLLRNEKTRSFCRAVEKQNTL